MSRSNSYNKFSNTIHRAWLLANLRHGLRENAVTVGGGSIDDYDDLGRASIVLAVAAMDSYFTDAFIEKLLPFLRNKKPTKGLIDILEKSGFGVKEALELLHEKKPFSRIRDILESYLSTYVTQSADKIDKLFLVYGYKELCKSAEKKCRRKTLIKTVEKLVRRRHEISHDGDYLKNGKLRKFEQSSITNQVQSMEKLIQTCDEILFP